MEEGLNDERQVSFRKFLNGFVNDSDFLSTQDDPIQFRGSIVGSFKLHANDVPAEIHDWVQLYLFQRKCPQELATLLAREVQLRIEALLPSIVPSLTNGGTPGTDSPDDGPYLLDSSLLYKEMLSQLHQVCVQLNQSEMELAEKSAAWRSPSYQTSLVAVKNTRRKMEDRHVIIHDLGSLCGLVDGPPQSYYAIFDGHSGAEAANFCSAHLHWNLVQHSKFECDPETALREAFATTEEQFEQRSQREGIKSGCTAVCCLIRDTQLYLAWLGDSQAILVKKGMPVTIMNPHKPERSDEKERVEKLGGCVMHVGTWRVNGILAVSRALGDFDHKPCVSSEPDIIQMNFDGDEDFLVLACDGLWDTLSSNDVTASIYHYISQAKHIDDIAAQLAQQAIERGSTDNVTVIIVFLRDLQTLAAQCAVTSFSSETFTNHSMLEEINNELESKGLVFENGENFCFKDVLDSVNTIGQDVFQKRGMFAVEQTSISELPTPPIEDLMESEGTECRKSSSNPFESDNNTEIHDSHAKEIASAILNSALESAALGESGGLCELDSGLQRFTDTAFFSGQVEVNPPLEAVAESGNLVEAQKPWVLQVQHSNQSNEIDYLPSSNPFATASQGDDDVSGQYPEYYVNAPVSQAATAPELDLLGDFNAEGCVESKESEKVNVPQQSLFVEQDLHELSPEMLKEAEMELKEVQSVLLQSAQVLASDAQSYEEAFTTMQNRFDLDPNAPLFVPADQSIYNQHSNQLLSNEPLQNPFETQPYEVMSVTQTSENLLEPEPVKSSQKDFLAVFEDVLVPSTPDEVSTSSELLQFDLTETVRTEEVLEVPETPERVFNMTETVPLSEMTAEVLVKEVSVHETTVQSSLLVDFIAPQMIMPELNDPEAVANLLTSDVPPTPEVVLEKIPDGVPEADGVTEDSDSEKDGGWSYVSAKASDTDKATVKKAKPGAATTTVKRTSGASKDTPKAATMSKTAMAKSAESKLKTKPALSKPTPPGSATLKKTTSDPAKKPPTSTMVRVKPSPTTVALKVAVGSTKTTVASSNTTTTLTKQTEVKTSVTKSATMARPASTLSKKTTTTATLKPQNTTSTVQSAKPTITKTSTMKPNKPASTTTAPRATTTASARPVSSTLNRTAPKPTGAARPASATNNTTTLSKKPEANSVSKPSTNTMKAASPRTSTTVTKTQKASAEIKQTKETANKQLVNQPGTLRNKLNSVATNKSASKTASATTTLTKSSTIRTASKTTKTITTSSKTVTKTAVKVENEEVQKVLIDEPTHSDTEKGSLEDNSKENQAVDSGLASPESPVSLQLSLVNGNHQVDAPIGEAVAVFEQSELN